MRTYKVFRYSFKLMSDYCLHVWSVVSAPLYQLRFPAIGTDGARATYNSGYNGCWMSIVASGVCSAVYDNMITMVLVHDDID